MNYCSVIVVRDGVVHENHLLLGDDRDVVARQAETLFVARAGELAPSFSGGSTQERDAALEDGYVRLPDGGSVCISWPENV